MCFLAVRVTKRIQPALIIQSNGVNDKIIALPLADGVAHPGGLEILGMTPAIDPDLPPYALVLKKHEDPVRCLHDLKWLGPDQNSRNAGGIAVQNRIITVHGSFRTVAGHGLVVAGLGPRCHIRGLRAGTAVKTLIRNSPDEEFIDAG